VTSLDRLTGQYPSYKPKRLIVAAIPAFNVEKTIAKIVLEAQKYVDVVLVCDDGSEDMTAEIAERLGADVIRHEKNLGYGAAIKTLFTMSRELNADVLVTLDGDGQHDPREIPALVEPVLENKADIVLGSRFLGSENDVPNHRRWGIKLITKLTGAASNHKLTDAQCGFRVYGRKALEGLSLFENGMGVSVESLMDAKRKGFTVTEVPTGCNYHGLEKTSTLGPLEHGASVVMSILRLVVEDKPLFILGVPGIVSLLVGMLFGIWMLKIYAVEQQITTNIALASMAFIMIGMFSIFTAITLYAIARQGHKNHNNE